MRVKLLGSRNVMENDDGAIENGSRRSVMFRIRNVRVRGRVVEKPDVVVVSVGVKSNLLFCSEEKFSHSQFSLLLVTALQKA